MQPIQFANLEMNTSNRFRKKNVIMPFYYKKEFGDMLH